MPSLSLTQDPSAEMHRLGRHGRAPGGYEWWRIEAVDDANNLRLIAQLSMGHCFDPIYLRRLEAFLNYPTRNAPPRSAEYPRVDVSIYRNGKVIAKQVARYPATEFIASDTDVRIGETELNFRNGEIRFSANFRASATPATANLLFRFPQTFLMTAVGNPTHAYAASAVPLDVSGAMRLANSPAIDIHGLGCCEHRNGDFPIAYHARQWMRGTVLSPSTSAGFSVEWPKNLDKPPEGEWFISDSQGPPRSHASLAKTGAWRMTMTGVSYPIALDVEKDFVLRRPKVIHSSLFSVTLTYDVYLRGQQLRAFCEIFQLNRLRWPIFGKRIEYAILPERKNAT